MKTFSRNITSLADNEIFVFGSNTQGRHGKGAALTAKKRFGAIYGQAEGRQGNSYAIITKDLTKANPLRSVSLKEIKIQVDTFIEYARVNANLTFYVVKFGSSLAGFSDIEISGMFIGKNLPDNIVMNDDYAINICDSKLDYFK